MSSIFNLNLLDGDGFSVTDKNGGVETRKRVVDATSFSEIDCNRCGFCCTNIVMRGGMKGALGFICSYAASIETLRAQENEWRVKYDPAFNEPLGVVEASEPKWMGWFTPQDAMLYMGQLIPTQDGRGEWTYRCGHYSDDEGCTVYEERPAMCVKYGDRPDETYGVDRGNEDGCTFDVEVLEFDVLL